MGWKLLEIVRVTHERHHCCHRVMVENKCISVMVCYKNESTKRRVQCEGRKYSFCFLFHFLAGLHSISYIYFTTVQVFCRQREKEREREKKKTHFLYMLVNMNAYIHHVWCMQFRASHIKCMLWEDAIEFPKQISFRLHRKWNENE